MDPATARKRMVDRLQRADRIERPATADALRAVPRHEFLPNHAVARAYEDRPLRIGDGQTVSAPHMVARITDLIAPTAGDRVLEIGTGCGYHAAVTSELVGEEGAVVSVEYHESLARRARERLARLGYPVGVRVGDGHDGWPPEAPYDACYLTCAAASVPDALREQVAGPIVAPVGRGRQTLVRLTPTADGWERESHGGVRFVPMVGGN